MMINQINVESEQTIKLTTSYGEVTIQFTDVTNGTIVEFNIISYKNQEVQFYLHFELNDENHAHQLYDEMIETLIGNNPCFIILFLRSYNINVCR